MDPLWKKYGLSIHPGIYRWDNQMRARIAHNAVADYLERHPEQHKDLLYEDGTAKYFEVLALAEREAGRKFGYPAQAPPDPREDRGR